MRRGVPLLKHTTFMPEEHRKSFITIEQREFYLYQSVVTLLVDERGASGMVKYFVSWERSAATFTLVI